MQVWRLDLHLLNKFASSLKLDAKTSADAGSEDREDEKHLSILCVRKQCVLQSHAPTLWGASCHLARTRVGEVLAKFRGNAATSIPPARGRQQRHMAVEKEPGKPPSTSPVCLWDVPGFL